MDLTSLSFGSAETPYLILAVIALFLGFVKVSPSFGFNQEVSKLPAIARFKFHCRQSWLMVTISMVGLTALATTHEQYHPEGLLSVAMASTASFLCCLLFAGVFRFIVSTFND